MLVVHLNKNLRVFIFILMGAILIFHGIMNVSLGMVLLILGFSISLFLLVFMLRAILTLRSLRILTCCFMTRILINLKECEVSRRSKKRITSTIDLPIEL